MSLCNYFLMEIFLPLIKYSIRFYNDALKKRARKKSNLNMVKRLSHIILLLILRRNILRLMMAPSLGVLMVPVAL
jgi:hypothetical protein